MGRQPDLRALTYPREWWQERERTVVTWQRFVRDQAAIRDEPGYQGCRIVNLEYIDVFHDTKDSMRVTIDFLFDGNRQRRHHYSFFYSPFTGNLETFYLAYKTRVVTGKTWSESGQLAMWGLTPDETWMRLGYDPNLIVRDYGEMVGGRFIGEQEKKSISSVSHDMFLLVQDTTTRSDRRDIPPRLTDESPPAPADELDDW
jgi:hypothetical protein